VHLTRNRCQREEREEGRDLVGFHIVLAKSNPTPDRGRRITRMERRTSSSSSSSASKVDSAVRHLVFVDGKEEEQNKKKKSNLPLSCPYC